jgi:hypothetical protein
MPEEAKVRQELFALWSEESRADLAQPRARANKTKDAKNFLDKYGSQIALAPVRVNDGNTKEYSLARKAGDSAPIPAIRFYAHGAYNRGFYRIQSGGERRIIKIERINEMFGDWHEIGFISVLNGYFLGETLGGPKIRSFGKTDSDYFFVEMEELYPDLSAETKINLKNIFNSCDPHPKKFCALLPTPSFQDVFTRNLAAFILRTFEQSTWTQDLDFIVTIDGALLPIDAAFWRHDSSNSRNQRAEIADLLNKMGARHKQVTAKTIQRLKQQVSTSRKLGRSKSQAILSWLADMERTYGGN